ncbi:MAG: aldo/keto reductase [Alphaproteobacteria bacterium MedPE-SWcel]|nr:MAG: aldo/keto reductase [Alphaproteobacteria bacterium MedPE-SWcel]
MKMNRLGRTDMMVSELCLGTMTYGTQTDEADAHAQIDMALDAGLNFLDTAEMYPVNPVRAETMGRSEEYIGSWNAKTGRRGAYILATKHSGEGSVARDGAPISSATIAATIEASLKRLRTDYIDLYQFHWPNRGSYMFRKNWTYDPTSSTQSRADVIADMEDCLGALQREVDRGTIRAFGLSNESAWGTAQWLRLSDAGKGPRVASIQNEYSFLCRLYDTDLAELSHYEDVGLLSFSPLAAGYLTGKYQNGAVPEGSRKSLNAEMGGRQSERVLGAVAAYLQIAADHGLDPVHMALAWCKTRPFMTSAIFGATNVTQLTHLLNGVDLELSDAVLADIDAAHRANPMPY